MEQLARKAHQGELNATSLDPAYIKKTYEELNEAAGKGAGNGWTKVNKATGNIPPEVIQMQRNLYKFSCAKSLAMAEQINNILQKQMSWDKFRAEVMKLNPKYNVNYLQAEWQTANQAARHARDWQYFQDNKILFPNLAYRTMGDSRVRDAHALLNGIVAPIDSDFWKTHFMPNGWRCRCYAVQTAEAPTNPENIPKLSTKEFPDIFRINTGITGQVFSEGTEASAKQHPYFALAKDAGQEYIENFEHAKLAAPPNTVFEKDGKSLKVSPFADEKDLQENITDAKILVQQAKVNVEIRAHLDGHILKNLKNPEYLIEDKIADRKAPQTAKAKNLRNIYKSANEQKCESLVLNLSKTALTLEEVMDEVRKKFKTFPAIKTIYIIDKNDDCVIMQKEPNK